MGERGEGHAGRRPAIYRLELDPQDPLRYRYEGGWKSLVPRIVSIRVRGEEKPRQFTFHDSHYGPVVARKGNEGFAAKLSYADEVRFGEAFYLFNIARNVAEFQRGLQLNQLMPMQNVMVADTSGSIYYQRAGRVPIRPDGFRLQPTCGWEHEPERMAGNPPRERPDLDLEPGAGIHAEL